MLTKNHKITRVIIFFLAVLFLPRITGAATTSWTRMVGGTDDDSIQKIAIDSSENVYVAGYTTSSFGGNTNSGLNDAFFAKYDKDGNQKFVKFLGSTQNDYAYSIGVDSNGNIYICGYTEGGDLGGNTAGDTDAFLAKYDSSGKQVWIKFLEGPRSYFLDLDIDSSGNIYVTGSTGNGIGSKTVQYGTDFLVAKYDSSGNLTWSDLIAGEAQAQTWMEDDIAYGIDLSGSGYLALIGITGGNLTGFTNLGSYDLIVAVYDTSGTQKTVKQFGSDQYDVATEISMNSANKFYFTGYSFGTVSAPASPEALPGGSAEGALTGPPPRANGTSLQAFNGVGICDEMCNISTYYVGNPGEISFGNLEGSEYPNGLTCESSQQCLESGFVNSTETGENYYFNCNLDPTTLVPGTCTTGGTSTAGNTQNSDIAALTTSTVKTNCTAGDADASVNSETHNGGSDGYLICTSEPKTNTVPELLEISAFSGWYGLGGFSIQLLFSEPVSSTGGLTFTFDLESTNPATHVISDFLIINEQFVQVPYAVLNGELHTNLKVSSLVGTITDMDGDNNSVTNPAIKTNLDGVKIDGTKPQVTESLSPGGCTRSGNAYTCSNSQKPQTLTLTCTDTGSGCNNIYHSPYNVPDAIYSEPFSINGPRAICYNADDKAGNFTGFMGLNLGAICISVRFQSSDTGSLSGDGSIMDQFESSLDYSGNYNNNIEITVSISASNSPVNLGPVLLATGCTEQLRLLDPDGTEYGVYDIVNGSVTVTVPAASVGQWTYEIIRSGGCTDTVDYTVTITQSPPTEEQVAITIPTLSEIGMIVLVILMIAVAFRRRYLPGQVHS